VVELETGSGLVPVEIDRDESGSPVFGRMQQPLPTVEPFADEARLLSVLDLERSELPVELYDNGATHIVVTLSSERAVAALTPTPSEIASFGVTGVNCIAGSGTSWKSRMFWPRGEDPATGSAAGPIACHVCRHGLVEWGEWIEITQGVEIRRPSTLFARANGAGGEIVGVDCGGRAVVVARGEFRI